jgi:F-type H+-transporting ATPase subunit delta
MGGPSRRSERPRFLSSFKAFLPIPGCFRAGVATTPNGFYVADDSRVTDVGAPYAQALFDLAVEEAALDAVEADLVDLKGLLTESEDLRRLIASPKCSVEDKVKGLTALAARAGFQKTTEKFLGLLAANGRTAALGEVIAAFQRLAADRRGLVSAQVVTAVPLTDAQTRGLVAALRQALGKEPQIDAVVDPAILGGLKVRVGSRLYDASLKTKLDTLKLALMRA